MRSGASRGGVGLGGEAIRKVLFTAFSKGRQINWSGGKKENVFQFFVVALSACPDILPPQAVCG